MISQSKKTTKAVARQENADFEVAYRSAELFSGCGGLALGLSRAGFHHELMVEWNSEAVTTVQFNQSRGIKFIRDWPLKQADVRDLDWEPLAGKLDLVAGGPPCQPFSIGGKHRGQYDARDMWPEAIRSIRETKPRAFLFENVRGLARPTFAPYLEWIVAHLQHPELIGKSGETLESHSRRLNAARAPDAYRILVLQVNAADYGAPQKRHRVIVAGLRADLGVELSHPSPTHSRERLLWEQWVSGDYWKRHSLAMPGDIAIVPSDMILVRKLRATKDEPKTLAWVTVRDALAGLGEPTGKENHVFQDGAKIYPGHTGSVLDQPAKALKAGDHGVPGGENMMVRDDGSVRYFTTREAARLQGLPDTYLFPRSWSESMRQLGNAVPTQLARAMGAWIVQALNEADQSKRVAA